jgi:hypothetical protein
MPLTIEVPSVEGQTLFNLRASDIEEKRVLYFESGAQEVWTCSLHGQLTFYLASGQQVDASSLCPAFPKEVN